MNDNDYNGDWLQALLDSANIGDVIELPPERIKVHSLILAKPLTLTGKPGTIIEVCGGAVIVDFSL